MIKHDAIIYGIKPEMVMCDSIIQPIFHEMGYGCVRTSVVGKKHSDGSLHPPGYAVDYRTKHINELTIKQQIVEEIKKALPCCDVILEHVDKPQEHIHVEFDPKNDTAYQQDKARYKATGNWPQD